MQGTMQTWGTSQSSLEVLRARMAGSMEVSGQGLSFRKMTPGKWGGQIQGRGRGGYTCAREVGHPGEGGGSSIPEVSVTEGSQPR